MSERNATASWSGFSHQGLVGIYVALKELQTVRACDYERYFIDYEKKEDFAIYYLEEDGISMEDLAKLTAKEIDEYYDKYCIGAINFSEVRTA